MSPKIPPAHNPTNVQYFWESDYLAPMRVAIIGYGKMGKEIEKVLLQRGHTISYIIDHQSQDKLIEINRQNTDVGIEFTGPSSAPDNLRTLISNGMPVVCGSTGWYVNLDEIRDLVTYHQAALVAATNFSLGVHLFFEAANHLARLFKSHPGYKVRINETHHTEKLDAPSGTAITLAKEVMSVMSHFDGFSQDRDDEADKIPLFSFREANVPGTHELILTSQIDEISLRHTAFNRSGFALGAVLAAEYIKDKTGNFTMRNILSDIQQGLF